MTTPSSTRVFTASEPPAQPENQRNIDTQNEQQADQLILTERARVYAQADTRTHERLLEVVEFTVHNRHYFTELAGIETIIAMTSVTPLPLTPSWVLGIINRSGSTVSLIDPTVFLSPKTSGLSDRRHVIVFRWHETEFGIAVDQCVAAHHISSEAITWLSGDNPSAVIQGKHAELGEYVNLAKLAERINSTVTRHNSGTTI